MSEFLSLTDIRRVYPAARQSMAARGVQTAAVLDVAFDVVLHELHRNDLFTDCGLVFKGGTALRKFDIGHKGRFSFDLDFDTSEDPDTVASVLKEVLGDMPDHGFRMGIGERRGHHSLVVQSNLFPDGAYEGKIDFSQRGLSLPTRTISPRPHPLSDLYPFAMNFKVPVINRDENMAEKLSRWRTTPLVRDLYDLSELAGSVKDHERVASLYVLKSYLGWAAAPPNRRPATPAVALMDTLTDATEESFDLADLVMPSAPSDTDKKRLVRQRLQRLSGLFGRLDVHIRGDALQRFASNTDGTLAYEAQQRLENAGVVAGLSGMGGPGGLGLLGSKTLGASPRPEVHELGSGSQGDTCGAKTTDKGRCGNPQPPVGGKCAAGHRRR